MNAGNSWIYLFSKFTSEALLFEGLLIGILCAGYAAFWILKKRRLGVIDKEVPAGVVRTYLNALIIDAEQLRAQLFGLLASQGVNVSAAAGAGALAAHLMAGNAAAPSAAAVDPNVLLKMSELESKMAEQSKAMAAMVAEKAKLEKELADAKAKSATGGSAPADAAEVGKLNDKIKGLESRLAEYSIIEDDLANLKRLQQENAQLKAVLGGQAPAAPEASAAPAAPAAEAASEPAAEAPAEAAAEAPAAEAGVEPMLADAAPVEAATGDPKFEGLVDQVEASIQESPAPSVEPAMEATPEAAPEPVLESSPISGDGGIATEAPTAAPAEKSDDLLVAEFEKMLQ